MRLRGWRTSGSPERLVSFTERSRTLGRSPSVGQVLYTLALTLTLTLNLALALTLTLTLP